MPRRVLCIGAGYVGGPTMAVVAHQCPQLRVDVVDLDAERIARWNSDQLPIHEPGLTALVEGCRGRNLFFSTPQAALVSQADLIFISVNTPTKTYGETAGLAPDLRYWESTARAIKPHLRDGTIIVEKSTVPVNTAQAITEMLHEGRPDCHFPVLSNPEFLAEGTAVDDLLDPPRVLVGHALNARGRAAAEVLATLYAHWIPRERLIFCDVWSSELAKLGANAMLAQRISSINALAAISERSTANIIHLSKVMGMDPRIGAQFLEAGVGFGGSCLRKDLLCLIYIAREQGLEEVAHYWEGVLRINDFQTRHFARQIVRHLFDTVYGKRIALLGFAFKPHTNDIRDTPALRVAEQLLSEKATLAIHDPWALDNAREVLAHHGDAVEFCQDVTQAAEGAQALALITAWPQYQKLDFAALLKKMASPAWIFDGRNQLDHQRLFELGYNVQPIGAKALRQNSQG